jgi:ABC-type oligopeptide transport system ATPase subunit
MQVENLAVAFPNRNRAAGEPAQLRAVDGVSFDIEAGEVFGLVGESGSGKTTLGKAMLRLYRPSEGRIRFAGSDITALGDSGLRPFRRDLQMIFQDPLSSFNPRTRIADAVALPLRLHRLCGRSEVEREVDRLLTRVGLSSRFRNRFPHEMSGGQLQRVAIARALISKPALLVADEPVSMIDASLRASIVNLLRDLRDRLGVSIIYITHDLATAYYISDRILIMRRGEAVESGDARTVLDNPQHPYSQLLKQSVLSPDPQNREGVLHA